MNAHLVLYEDRHWRALRPLTDTLPVMALAFGASTLATRWRRATGARWLALEARPRPLAAWHEVPALEATTPQRGDEVLALNGAALPGEWLARALAAHAPALFVGDRRIAGARLPFEMVASGLGRGPDFEAFLLGLGLPAVQVPDARFVSHPWNLVEWNAEAIAADLAGEPGRIAGEVHPSAALIAPERIVVEPGARVEALAVLDATDGPIQVGAGALVRPHTVVNGPCVIGARTQLLGGFVSRSTFGPECRIAGEVEECVWQGHGNKRHHGFVGHSVFGEWVNLGALTTTSDLKNNYGPVRVWIDGTRVDSGNPKVGSVVGAHVKTGIGSLLPTGCAVGVGANLFGGGRFAPAAVPAFAWWDGVARVEHRLDAFLATARVAMSRRGRAMTPADEALLRALFEDTAKERARPADE
jgi:UDP-N-acetylglucosamine diphosphorylase / glucose-1-phosphate thymidylyltransferase / UDP-N-acetylgalactosamine diphosphorylase / glucosamine-1-phosphate N-acetyltransferase / galactosamine-1-phosphate N-acetyltransferase